MVKAMFSKKYNGGNTNYYVDDFKIVITLKRLRRIVDYRQLNIMIVN
jgi:hypothetical protein